MQVPIFEVVDEIPNRTVGIPSPTTAVKKEVTNPDSTSKVLQSAIVACCQADSRMARDTNSEPGMATINPGRPEIIEYKKARRQGNDRVRSIMPMHPLSFGSIEEQTLDLCLPLVCRPRSLTTDIRTRRFPNFAMHEFDGCPRRWRTMLGLVDRVVAVLVRVRVIGFFAHHWNALMVLGTPAAAPRFFVLLMAGPCAVAQS
jgi:hypothetical protein